MIIVHVSSIVTVCVFVGVFIHIDVSFALSVFEQIYKALYFTWDDWICTFCIPVSFFSSNF